MRPALLSLCVTLAALAATASETKPVVGKVTVYIADTDDRTIKKTPVMVSLLLKGKVVAQGEINTDTLKIFHDLPVGVYEVRAEGAGLASIVKHGVVVTPKGDTEIRFVMKAGKGAKVIEYSTWNASRDELEALVKRLEKAIERLEKK